MSPGLGKPIVQPPSRTTASPLKKLPWSDASKSASGAMSSGLPKRLVAMRSRTILEISAFMVSAAANFVSTRPGQIALMRMPSLPSSIASVLVIEITAAFVIA